MINLKTDTLYSWRYDADGTALNIPSEGAFNVFGGDPIAAFNQLIDQVYQSPIITLWGDHLNANLELFRPDNADGFYGTSDIFQDYRFSGSPDNDYILGYGDAFRANTGHGNDVVVFGYVTDAVDDPLVGGDRLVRAGKGDDLISSSTFEDNRIFGQQGNDVISVSGANNFVKGGRGQDVIIAEGIFEDSVSLLKGGRGSDDIIAIGQGSAVLNGGRGNDTLMSTVENSVFKGGRGQDQIIMDGHINTATGGRGADQFVFTFTNDADRVTTITDFQVGVDELAISNDFYNRFDVSNTIYGNVYDPVIGAGDMIVTTDNYGTVIFQNLTVEDQIAVAQYVGSEFDFIGA